VESDGVVLNGTDEATELADTRSNGGECDSYSGDDDFCVLDENGCELLVFGGGGTGAADASTAATDLLPPPPPTSVANTSVRRVAISKKRRLTETVSRRHSSVVAVAAASSTANSFKPQRKSLDSDPEPFFASDDHSSVLLPRLSLRRDVKNEKRISYTKTKITGELGGSSGSTLTTSQSQRRSAVVISPPTNGKSPPLQHMGGTTETHLQNGGGGALSDCSTSTTDSERRFSERRFKGMPGRMNRSSAPHLLLCRNLEIPYRMPWYRLRTIPLVRGTVCFRYSAGTFALHTSVMVVSTVTKYGTGIRYHRSPAEV
jgi:hypothetical protein